jgi:1,4-dihydroxy-6-naphthoate synthase
LLLTGGEEFLESNPILVPGEQTTANFLLDFWLAGRPIVKRFLAFDQIYAELRKNPKSQGVVIHEARFTYEDDGLKCIADLGAHWESETQCPIPLGGILGKRMSGMNKNSSKGSANDSDPGMAYDASQGIRASMDWAYQNYDKALDLCRQHAPEMPLAVLKSHIALYVNDFSRSWGDEGRAAVEHLLTRLGVTPQELVEALPQK